MKDSLIQPTNFDLPQLRKSIILFHNLFLFFRFREFISGSKARPFGISKFFNVKEKPWSIVGGILGAPQAMITIENLLLSSPELIINVGTAGCLSNISKHELIVSPEFYLDGSGITQELGLQSKVSKGKNKSQKGLFTTNLLYNLTPDHRQKLLIKGVNYIDMESAPFISFLENIGVHSESFYLISDHFTGEDTWENIQSDQIFEQSLLNLFRDLSERVLT